MPTPPPPLLRLLREGALPSETVVTSMLVAAAADHGMAPLLDAAAREAGIDRDHEALIELAMHSLDSAAEMRAASNALVRLLGAASTFNIEVAVFKGLAIATQWYEDPGRRPAADVDVFVNPGDVERLPDLIGVFTDRPEAAGAVRAMIDEGRVFEYSLLVEGVTIDVHLDPMNLVVPTQQRDIMWERTNMVTLADGHTVRTLDLELSVVQLLLNLFRDSFADLLHFHDLDLLLNDAPDWDFIESFVEVEGWTDIVRYSLAVGCDVLGRTSPLPRAIARGNRVAIERIWPREVRMAGSDSLARSQRRQSLVSLLIEHRRRDVARSLARRLFPPRSVIDDRFPDCACPYPIALLRWRLSQRAENRRRTEVPVRRVRATI